MLLRASRVLPAVAVVIQRYRRGHELYDAPQELKTVRKDLCEHLAVRCVGDVYFKEAAKIVYNGEPDDQVYASKASLQRDIDNDRSHPLGGGRPRYPSMVIEEVDRGVRDEVADE